MITQKIFKNIILTQLALIFTLFAIVIADESVNPDDEDLSFSLIEIVSLIIGFIYFISLFMLFKLKPIGEEVVCINTCFGYCYYSI
ncbi:hypothetical protein N9826_04690 [Flavobacteriaceae bacterium]|nr:hypothetical protein [Flavobacteriaceae bacterium]